jgi:hypothetical protein
MEQRLQIPDPKYLRERKSDPWIVVQKSVKVTGRPDVNFGVAQRLTKQRG